MMYKSSKIDDKNPILTRFLCIQACRPNFDFAAHKCDSPSSLAWCRVSEKLISKITKWCTKVRKSMTKFQFWPCFCTYKFMCALQKYGLRRTSLIRSVKLNFVRGTKMRKWGAKVRKLRTEIQNSGNFCTQRENGRETNIPNFLGTHSLTQF